MAWCKDYCLVCERETRVESGTIVPYCSQACRLIDHDRQDEPLCCHKGSKTDSAPDKCQDTTPESRSFTRLGIKEAHVGPLPSTAPALLTRRLSTSPSCSSNSLNYYSDTTSSSKSGKQRRTKSYEIPFKPQTRFLNQTVLYDPLGKPLAISNGDPTQISSVSSSSSRSVYGCNEQDSEVTTFTHLRQYTLSFHDRRQEPLGRELQKDYPDYT